ncbi:hypothetical protein CSC94_08230 [Zhengella mangrovi]|uniref:Cobalamin biosynthesis protein CbiX n=1 Tax=Zhengella mangrovi TaxID=1982044 RepID=A0A2G1QQA8_9HYPH|nr:hypothetical protein CSC94_08230 [Zhengella mangrovi]
MSDPCDFCGHRPVPVNAPLLLLAAHGERGGQGDNARLREICRLVAAAAGSTGAVRCGVLSGLPSLEQAVRGEADRQVVVYPVFMSEGYFVREALPARLQAAGVKAAFLPALGTDPAFAAACADHLRVLDDGRPDRVLVAAHGSTKDDRSRRATEAFAADLAGHLGVPVSCAYLEEAPFVAEALTQLEPSDALVSLFAGHGLHGADDMSRIVAARGFPPGRVITPAADMAMIARLAASAFAGWLARNEAP